MPLIASFAASTLVSLAQKESPSLCGPGPLSHRTCMDTQLYEIHQLTANLSHSSPARQANRSHCAVSSERIADTPAGWPDDSSAHVQTFDAADQELVILATLLIALHSRSMKLRSSLVVGSCCSIKPATCLLAYLALRPFPEPPFAPISRFAS